VHKKILLSARFPEVNFRPDHVDGKVLSQGPSAVQVHGILGILGNEHEISIPVQVDLEADHWHLTSHFDMPYSALFTASRLVRSTSRLLDPTRGPDNNARRAFFRTK